ncbi:interphotoreceptor matrix proteoglycan 1 [Poecilia latipinna]|nr:PREDICTED: interphotoreceptor matrix proteoglycan 1 [Poecilia latipinna]
MLQAAGLLLLLAITSPAAGIRDGGAAAHSVESGGSLRLADLLKSSSKPSAWESSRRRSRRSVFLQPGVRICSQESVDEVLASHQAYYQLRVCQEAVWEAFRIFLDRIPGTWEYQAWVRSCQQEALCISDIARNFSSSEEHIGLIHRRMKNRRERRPETRAVTPAAKQKTPELPGSETLPSTSSSPPPAIIIITSAAPPTPVMDRTGPAGPDQEDPELPNLVPEGPEVHTVQFSVSLLDPGYRQLLGEPDSPEYLDLATHLQDQMRLVFDRLPGFKAVSVLGIRETLEPDRAEGISVHYSVVFENNIHHTTSETTREPEASADSGLRDMLVKALQEKASLPVDLDSLNFQPEVIILPTPTSSAAEEMDEPSEYDSHNEFKVFTPEPEVNKLHPPLTSKEKENDLVTLLDSTAVTHGEMITVTDGMALISDDPPASEDITDDSEEIYMIEPELSSQEQEEEELLIITHEIETIHQDETGELVRVYIPTPTLLLQGEADDPFITSSPNLISEEDLSPVEKEGESPVFKPTAQIVFTAAVGNKELSEITTPSFKPADLTDQPPTEPALIPKEEEDINILSHEEKLDLGFSKPEPSDVLDQESQGVRSLQSEVELLEPEEDTVILEVLRPNLEKVEVSEPGEVAVEMSESGEATFEVSMPEKKEKPSEFITEVVDISNPATTPDTLETEAPEVSEPHQEVQQVLLMDKEVVNVSMQEKDPTKASETKKQLVVESQEEVTEPEPEIVVPVTEKDLETLKSVEPEEPLPETDSDDTKPEVFTEQGVEDSVNILQPEKGIVELTELKEEQMEKVIEVSLLIPQLEENLVEAPEKEEEVVLVGSKDEKVLERPGHEVLKETLPQVPEEKGPDVTEERVPIFIEDRAAEVTKETIPRVTEEERVPKHIEDRIPERSEESVTKVTQVMVPGDTEENDNMGGVADRVSEPQEAVPDLDREEVREKSVHVVKLQTEDVTEVANADFEDEKVVVASLDESLVDIAQPEPSTEKTEAIGESKSPELETVSEPDKDRLDFLPDLPKGPEPEEEVIEPETKRDSTEPATESIKILQTLESMEELHYRDGSVQVVGEQPLDGSDELNPSVEDNLPIVPGLFHSPEEKAPNLIYPITEDVDTQEDVDGTNIEVEREAGAFRIPEPVQTDLPIEAVTSVSAATAAELEVQSEDTVATDNFSSKTQEEEMFVTRSPVSEAVSAPPSAVDLVQVPTPGLTEDSGPFELTEDRSEPEPPVVPQVETADPESLTASPGGEEFSEELDQSNTPSKESMDPGSDLTTAAEEDATPLRYLTTPTMTTASNRQELVVFFSLRLTNMDFSEDLFNNTSAEYRALENTLLDVLLPYLQANLTGFRKLEILNFRKGSVVVNSKMRFSRSVPYNVTEAVRCLLERFCSAARRLQIDRSSLDVEPADRADPCRFLACGDSSHCVVDHRTQEARCHCEPGFLAQQNRSCRSVCELQPEFCPDGDCHVVPGRGAECRPRGGSQRSGLTR